MTYQSLATPQADIQYDQEWEEWIVRLGKATYHTDDKADAIDTARCMEAEAARDFTETVTKARNESERYNGWTNHETWAAALHIDNDYGSYQHRCALVEEAKRYAEENDCSAVGVLADVLKDWITEAVEIVHYEPDEGTQWARLMSHDVGSLWRVEWREIAESFLDE